MQNFNIFGNADSATNTEVWGSVIGLPDRGAKNYRQIQPGELSRDKWWLENPSKTRKGLLEKKTNVPPNPARVVILVNNILSCSTYVPSIIKIYQRVVVLQSRDKKSNSTQEREITPKVNKA